MQITSRFTIAVHILTCIEMFQDERRVTSDFLAGSTGVNAVIIRNVLSQLREAGIVSTRQGSDGASLAKPLNEISFYDIYQAVDCVDNNGLFHFHENPNPNCPVGRNIHAVMDDSLNDVQGALENQMKAIKLDSIVAKARERIEREN